MTLTDTLRRKLPTKIPSQQCNWKHKNKVKRYSQRLSITKVSFVDLTLIFFIFLKFSFLYIKVIATTNTPFSRLEMLSNQRLPYKCELGNMNKVDYFSMNLTRFKKSTLTMSNNLRQLYKRFRCHNESLPLWILQHGLAKIPHHFNFYTDMSKKA